MSVMGPGKHISKIVAYGVKKAKEVPAGQPPKFDQVMVEFENQTGESITWYGSLSPAAFGYTWKTLVERFELMCGPGEVAKCVKSLAVNGIDSALFNTDKTYELVVEAETYNNKVTNKVKYVNEVGGAAKMDEADIGNRYDYLDDMAGAVADINSKTPARTAGAAKRPDTIPF